MRRPLRPALGTLTAVAAFVASALVGASLPPALASPGCPAPTTSTDTSTLGGVARTFTVSVVLATSDCDFAVPVGVTSLDVLVVGGGGGGGGGVFYGGGGGGGGGGQVVETTAAVDPTSTLAIAVGGGGSAGVGGPDQAPANDTGVTAGNIGGPSTITDTATSTVLVSAAGGAGGGKGTTVVGPLVMAGYGGASGSGSAGGTPDYDGAGGGGGQSGPGAVGVDLAAQGGDGGAGGAGVSSSITGAVSWYAAGGGGGGATNYGATAGTGGAGGSGVGGAGSVNLGIPTCGTPASAGTANTGSGGGGGGGVGNSVCWSPRKASGGAGAAGVVVIRYATGANLTGATASGTAQVGQTLTAVANGVSGNPTPTAAVQWQTSTNGTSGWTNISGATSTTVTLTSQDVDQYLRAEVTVANTDGSAVTTTNVVGPIGDGTNPAPTPAPAPTPTPLPSATPTPTATATPTPSPTVAPVVAPRRVVRPVAGPVSRVRGEAVAVTTPVRADGAVTPTLTGAPHARAAVGDVVRVGVSGVPASSRLTVAIRVGGRWSPLGVANSGTGGRATLPAFTSTKPGTFPLRITTPGNPAAFVTASISAPGR